MLRDQKKNKDIWHYKIHTEIKVETGRTYSKNERARDGPNTEQSGNQGEVRDQGEDQAEDDKTIWQRRREPPGTGK